MFPDRTTALIIVLCAAGIALLLVGFHWYGKGVDRGEAKSQAVITELSQRLAKSEAGANNCASALAEVNRQTEQAQRQAEANHKFAAELVRQSLEDAKTYQDGKARILAELDQAKRAPTCRAQLEQPLCVALH